VSLPKSMTFQDAMRDISRQKRSAMSKRITQAFQQTFVGEKDNMHSFRMSYSRDMQRKLKVQSDADNRRIISVEDDPESETVETNDAPDWTSTALYLTFLYRCHIQFESLSE
jgi:hypothetical protein